MTNVNPLTLQAKTLINETNERETSTMNGDNIRYDSPPTINMGNIVSPKKKFLIRSQSHTEPTSPLQNNNNNNSQSQKSDNSILNTQNGFDDENSMDDSIHNGFTRIPDLHTGTHPSDTHVNNNHQFKPVIDNTNDLNIQLRLDPSNPSHSMNKQQTIIINSINQNKRPYSQANLGKT